MPEPALAMPASRINPTAFLWLLFAIGAATMNAPADLLATLHHLRVPDPDDAMRLVEVRDFVNGQGWYDLVQRRFGPPAGIPSHWSRLVDAPLAGLILALTPLFGRSLAEGAAAVLWPSLLFGVYAIVLYRGLRANFGGAPLWSPRRGDADARRHDPVRGGAGRSPRSPAHRDPRFGTGGHSRRGTGRVRRRYAWGVFPGGRTRRVAVPGGRRPLFLTGDWILRGRPALSAFVGFGAGLGCLAPLLFGAQVSPALWNRTACDALSPPWLFLAGGGFAIGLAARGSTDT